MPQGHTFSLQEGKSDLIVQINDRANVQPCVAMPFDTLTASLAGAKPKQPSPIQVIVDLQRRIYEATDNKNLTGGTLATLARAWSELEERKRVMRMKPAPKPIDVVDPRKGKAKTPRSSFSEGPEPAKASPNPAPAPDLPKP